MNKLIESIEDNECGTGIFEGSRHKVPMQLTLQYKGHKLEITNPSSISLIAQLCKDGLETISASDRSNSMKVDCGYFSSESVRIWFFASLMKKFFNLFPQFAGQKKQKGGVSKSSLLLISKLAYFIGLTSNPDYDSTDDNLKALLKQYRDYTLDTVNTIYG